MVARKAKSVRARTIPAEMATSFSWYCVCCARVLQGNPVRNMPWQRALMPGCVQYELFSSYEHVGCQHALTRSLTPSVAVVVPVPRGWTPTTAVRHPTYPHDFVLVNWGAQDLPVHWRLNTLVRWRNAVGDMVALEPPLSILPLPCTVHAHHTVFPAVASSAVPAPSTVFPWPSLPSSLKLTVPTPAGPRELVVPLDRPADNDTADFRTSDVGLIDDTGFPPLKIMATVFAAESSGHVRRWTVTGSTRGYRVDYWPDAGAATTALGPPDVPPQGHLKIYAVVDVDTINAVHDYPEICGGAAAYTGVRFVFPAEMPARLTREDLPRPSVAAVSDALSDSALDLCLGNDVSVAVEDTVNYTFDEAELFTAVDALETTTVVNEASAADTTTTTSSDPPAVQSPAADKTGDGSAVQASAADTTTTTSSDPPAVQSPATETARSPAADTTGNGSAGVQPPATKAVKPQANGGYGIFFDDDDDDAPPVTTTPAPAVRPPPTHSEPPTPKAAQAPSSTGGYGIFDDDDDDAPPPPPPKKSRKRMPSVFDITEKSPPKKQKTKHAS